MSVEKPGGDDKYHFHLYIDSEKPKCFSVAERLSSLCQQYLPDSHTVKVIDLRDDLSIIEQMHIIAVPTLFVTTPQQQTHRFVGDLSQSEVVILALGMARQANKMGQDADKMVQEAVKMRDRIKSP